MAASGSSGSALKAELLGLLSGAAAHAAGAPASHAQPGFCCSGRLGNSSPGLVVSGLGGVHLPLGSELAAALRQLCAAAPYGRGEETLLDPAVRRCWQLDPGLFALESADWKQEVQRALQHTKAALGIAQDTEVQAQLYKLLLYDEGAFFKSHRDSEKVDGMFGTLVITLPSLYQGGELLVRHAGREECIDLAAQNGGSACFAAFYAGLLTPLLMALHPLDCEHEIKPVTSGYRLALVYNLVAQGAPLRPQAQDAGAAECLVALVRRWDDSPAGSEPGFLCYMLDHSYSQESIELHGAQALKGTDRAAVELALAACQGGAPLDASLALVTRFATWDDEEEEDDVPDRATDRATQFSMVAGPPPAFSSLDMKRDQLVQGDYWSGQPATKERLQASGNEGTYVARWYRRVGLMLWPHSRRLINTVRCDVGRAILRLHKMLNPEEDPAQLPAGHRAADALEELARLERWRAEGPRADEDDICAYLDSGLETGPLDYSSGDHEHGWEMRERRRNNEEQEGRQRWGPEPAATPQQLAQAILLHLEASDVDGDTIAAMLVLTLELGSAPLCDAARKLLAGKEIRSGQLESVFPAAVHVAAHVGWPAVWRDALLGLVQNNKGYSSWRWKERNASLLEHCVNAVNNSPDQAGLECATALALQLARSLHTDGCRPHAEPMDNLAEWMPAVLHGLGRVRTPGAEFALEHVVSLLLSQPVPSLRRQACGDTAAGVCVALMRMLGTNAAAEFARSPTLLRLLARCLCDNHQQMGSKPVKPADWRKEVELPCRPTDAQQELCPSCTALQAFAHDPRLRECTSEEARGSTGHLAQFAYRHYIVRETFHVIGGTDQPPRDVQGSVQQQLVGLMLQCLLLLPLAVGTAGQPASQAPASPGARPAKKAAL